MNKRRNASGRLGEEIADAGAPPHGDQVPSLEKYSNMEHAPVNPSPLTDDNIRTALLQMSQAIITQAQMTTAQAQAMTAQANQEVLP